MTTQSPSSGIPSQAPDEGSASLAGGAGAAPIPSQEAEAGDSETHGAFPSPADDFQATGGLAL